ncbi:GAF domain-containing sensor histidine kinase [Roseospira visakhapatnamensis]|uniref:histidine kinase n=1 Tax=Roseospira visakhapatnamensis TaxID=390880 RepID=A0A7W6W8I5_9PROT|nr:GAF domain-containing sensor histidine kinase [Roseospira visakhapatnamensis]MBB4264441.1 signal transduction histidine kinase [Roseospira visakhapatnamensis]
METSAQQNGGHDGEARGCGGEPSPVDGFICAPVPANEAERLRALQRYGVLDSDADRCFDRITALTARLMDTGMALVSLVDVDRQFFLSRQGLEARQTPRQVAFCAHAILTDDIFEVPDAILDPRFAGNPLVVGPPFIRYYIGKPLRTRDGYRLGTLCAVDQRPRDPVCTEQRGILADLGETVMELIETRVWALEAESERQLARRMTALKDEYFASMTHELRTPVNALTGFSELLRMTGAPEVLTERQRTYLDSIVEASEYLGLLVNQTLDAHSPTASEDPGRGGAVPLGPLLGAVRRLLSPLARKQGVTLEVADGGDVMVWGDALRARQVFINLVSNAVKYNRRGGTVTVSVDVEPDWVSVICRDTGPGIPEEELPKLFSAFHRIAETSEGVEGTGLGLRITERLVRVMGGRLTVDSTVGTGTAFTVTLARAGRPEAESA